MGVDFARCLSFSQPAARTCGSSARQNARRAILLVLYFSRGEFHPLSSGAGHYKQCLTGAMQRSLVLQTWAVATAGPMHAAIPKVTRPHAHMLTCPCYTADADTEGPRKPGATCRIWSANGEDDTCPSSACAWRCRSSMEASFSSISASVASTLACRAFRSSLPCRSWSCTPALRPDAQQGDSSEGWKQVLMCLANQTSSAPTPCIALSERLLSSDVAVAGLPHDPARCTGRDRACCRGP